MNCTTLYRFFLGAMLLLSASCEELEDSRVPSLRVMVNANIDHNYQTLSGLNYEGGHAYIKTRFNEAPYIGFGGILIIRDLYESSVAYSFDLACPVENKPDVQIEYDNLIGKCPQCHSEYNGLSFGNPMPSKGPAKEKGYRLRTYSTTFSKPMISVNN